MTIETIGLATPQPSLRGALATKQSKGHSMCAASNPDGRTAAPGLLRFARNDGRSAVVMHAYRYKTVVGLASRTALAQVASAPARSGIRSRWFPDYGQTAGLHDENDSVRSVTALDVDECRHATSNTHNEVNAHCSAAELRIQ
jgi:hypothetical protein